MATPLTDSINALTAYANEVTGQSDMNLSDAVHTLASGYGGGSDELTIGVGLNPSVMNIWFPSSVKTLIIESLVANQNNGRLPTFILDSFRSNAETESIILNYGTHRPVNVIDSFRGGAYSTIKKIVLNVDLSGCTSWDRFLYGTAQSQGIEITGTPVDFSAMTRWSDVIRLKGLKEIRFAPNTLSVSPTITDTYNNMFSDETWVSFANCFNDSINGTVTVGSNAISTITNITGNNDNSTFVADPNGAMTLADFITTVKGWTLA